MNLENSRLRNSEVFKATNSVVVYLESMYNYEKLCELGTSNYFYQN